MVVSVCRLISSRYSSHFSRFFFLMSFLHFLRSVVNFWKSASRFDSAQVLYAALLSVTTSLSSWSNQLLEKPLRTLLDPTDCSSAWLVRSMKSATASFTRLFAHWHYSLAAMVPEWGESCVQP